MKRRRIVAGFLLAALVLLLAHFWTIGGWPWNAPPASHTEPADVAAPHVEEVAGITVLRGTDFDRGYLAESGNAREDLRLLAAIWSDATLLVKNLADRPLADNVDFVSFFTGDNPHRVAWIRPGHPAVSAQGELLDRWGTPVFFHRESSSRTSLRSAGPDRAFWTDDDIVLESEPTQ